MESPVTLNGVVLPNVISWDVVAKDGVACVRFHAKDAATVAYVEVKCGQYLLVDGPVFEVTGMEEKFSLLPAVRRGRFSNGTGEQY